MINSKGQFCYKDISGIRFSKLLAISRSKKDRYGTWMWLCVCDCGNYTEVRVSHLTHKSNPTQSCGCLLRRKGQNKTHGLRKHPLYDVWRAMKYRCCNTKAKNYPNYGGRGITICERWVNSFQSFYDDMLSGYIKGEVMLDRIDVNGNYEPSNCRWISYIGSANNKRASKYLSLNGIVRTASEWGRLLGIRDDTIRSRKAKGYPDHICLSINPIKYKSI